jgi:hypothetical protein
LFACGLASGNDFLQQCAGAAWKDLPTDTSFGRARAWFRLLKILLSRPHSPDFYPAGPVHARRFFVYDAQLLGVAVEAGAVMTGTRLKCRYNDVVVEGVAKLIDVPGLIPAFLDRTDDKLPEDVRRACVPLPPDGSVLLLLSSLYTLLTRELSGQVPVKATAIDLTTYGRPPAEELRVQITCDGALPLERLHLGHDAEHHSLGKLLKNLSACVGCSRPALIAAAPNAASLLSRALLSPFTIGVRERRGKQRAETYFLFRFSRYAKDTV